MKSESVEAQANGLEVTSVRRGDTRLELRARGAVDFGNVETLRLAILAAARPMPHGSELLLDLEAIRASDSAVAGLILGLLEEGPTHGVVFRPEKIDPTTRSLLALAPPDHLRPALEVAHEGFHPLFALGDLVIQSSRELKEMVQFIGRVVLSMLWSLRRPDKVRWGEIAFLIQRTGVEALPIVALMSLLVGLVTGFSSAIQLKQFGANVFIANLIGIGMTREMGPLMAAILLTGRSGSAFAAEIGTMKISDEIDALRVMGIHPLDYLVMPRIFAVMLTLPLLTLFADIAGIVGGMVIAAGSLDLSPLVFIRQLRGAIGVWDVTSGVLKAFVFGILVAGVGCYRGMETSGGALGVGRSTTASVVSGIFLIVIADSLFVILFHYLGAG